jgi:hypothetical protein
VAIASSVPLDIHGLPSRVFTVEGRARTDPGFDQALANTVTPGYFATMGIPLRAGVDFAGLDDDAAPPQVIVNEAFVRLYLGRNDMHAALGRRLEARGGRYIIIGVARNSLYNAFGEPPIPIIYFSYRDRPPLGGEIHVRSRPGSETALVPAVRAIVRALDEDLPIYNVRTLTVHIENNLIFRRVPARMFAVLGPLLLMLAAIGIYAVVAYTVSQRTAEVGIRRALGASSGRVVFDLMRQSLVIIGAGALIGWLGAVVVARGLVPSGRIDPAVFTAAPLILISVAVVACWLPARRAARVDPMVALRRD